MQGDTVSHSSEIRRDLSLCLKESWCSQPVLLYVMILGYVFSIVVHCLALNADR